MFKLNSVLLHAGLTALLAMVASAPAHAQIDPLSVFEPSLKTVPVPVPFTINDYFADRDAAVRLGKALFWDVRLGSDGMTACATCHQVRSDSGWKKQSNTCAGDASMSKLCSKRPPASGTFAAMKRRYLARRV